MDNDGNICYRLLFQRIHNSKNNKSEWYDIRSALRADNYDNHFRWRSGVHDFRDYIHINRKINSIYDFWCYRRHKRRK